MFTQYSPKEAILAVPLHLVVTCHLVLMILNRELGKGSTVPIKLQLCCTSHNSYLQSPCTANTPNMEWMPNGGMNTEIQFLKLPFLPKVVTVANFWICGEKNSHEPQGYLILKSACFNCHCHSINYGLYLRIYAIVLFHVCTICPLMAERFPFCTFKLLCNFTWIQMQIMW